MTILVDMDDTIEYFVKGWVKFNNLKFGTDVKVEDINDWDMSLAFPMLTHDQVYAAEKSDELWDYVEPIPGAAETLKRLYDEGHEIFIVSSTYYETLRTKMEKVLFRFFPFITWDKVIITHHKDMVKGDILIDDGPHNLKGGEYKKILFDASHNRNFDESTVGAVRARNWDEVYQLICAMNMQ